MSVNGGVKSGHMAAPVAATMVSQADIRRFSLRAEMYNSTPSRASASALAKPSPALPPFTIALRLLIARSICSVAKPQVEPFEYLQCCCFPPRIAHDVMRRRHIYQGPAVSFRQPCVFVAGDRPILLSRYDKYRHFRCRWSRRVGVKSIRRGRK